MENHGNKRDATKALTPQAQIKNIERGINAFETLVMKHFPSGSSKEDLEGESVVPGKNALEFTPTRQLIFDPFEKSATHEEVDDAVTFGAYFITAITRSACWRHQNYQVLRQLLGNIR